MALISVIIPVYNVEKYIARCVDSILAQSFTDFEVVLIDDGSPDNCGEICDRYAGVNKRIHVIHQRNRGLSAARNVGIDWAFRESDSKWLTFVDSDDWVHERYLETLFVSAIKDKTEISVCAFEQTEGNSIRVDMDQLKSIVLSPDDFYYECNVLATIACGKLYRKECFMNVRYPENKIHEDEFTTYKILFQYSGISFVKAPLYSYFINENSITKSKWNPDRMLSIQAAEEQLDYFKKNGFTQAWRRRTESYVCVIANQIECLKFYSGTNKKEYLRLLRKKLRQALLKYRHQILFHNNKWIYEQAYPRIMYIYWILAAQLGKLRRKRRCQN